MAKYIPLSPSEFWKSLKISDNEYLCLKCISVGILVQNFWDVNSKGYTFVFTQSRR